jgi:hypothetical protein
MTTLNPKQAVASLHPQKGGGRIASSGNIFPAAKPRRARCAMGHTPEHHLPRGAQSAFADPPENRNPVPPPESTGNSFPRSPVIASYTGIRFFTMDRRGRDFLEGSQP